ncbi:MAG TPA: hypothetical protein VMN58_13770, partial [Acidimicrobiales bacterium]|nr:hypothetical protein [Acidimicrobiales bacterium]
MVTIEYRCADGTPFPVTFRDADDATRRWRCEREHGREPQTPMAAALVHLGLPGAERAHTEVGLVLPPTFRPGPEASGFAYFVDGGLPADVLNVMFTGCAQLVERHGSALRIWHDHCLPAVKACCDQLDAAGDEVSLQALAELQHYGMQLTMIPAFVCGNDLDLLTATCRDAVGEEAATLVASELTQGYANETLRADDDLWRLGRSAAAGPRVAAALLADDPAAAMATLRADGAEPAFFAELDAFLDEWGGRCESWDIACPTWREQRGGFWSQLRQMAADDVPPPRLALERGAKRREALAADVDDRLAGDPATQARFRRRLARVADYVAVREERARWQLVLAGSLRSALLRRGRGLARRGVIADAEDILFLLPAEVEAGEGELGPLVASRRAAHERWRT